VFGKVSWSVPENKKTPDIQYEKEKNVLLAVLLIEDLTHPAG